MSGLRERLPASIGERDGPQLFREDVHLATQRGQRRLDGVLTGASAVVVWHLFATATTTGSLMAIPSVVVGVTVSTATIALASAVERVVETERFPLDA